MKKQELKQSFSRLFYCFEPRDIDRTFVLNPVSAGLNALKILSVKLDGNNYNNFNGDTRELTVDATVGGIFEIQFDIKGNTTYVINPVAEKEFEVIGNYPNLWSRSTTIAYKIPEANQVEIILRDLSGRKVITLMDKYQPAGSYEVQFNRFDMPELSPGLYFYNVTAGDLSETKKMIFVAE